LGWFNVALGWRLAVAIIATQVLGNLVNIYRVTSFVEDRLSDRRSLAVYLLQPQLRSASHVVNHCNAG